MIASGRRAFGGVTLSDHPKSTEDHRSGTLREGARGKVSDLSCLPEMN